MMIHLDMKIVKVFVDEKNNHGNPVGIIVDEEQKYSRAQRQKLAVNSGLSEIVFVNNVKQGSISIFSPTREIPFAGHAVLGVVFFFRTNLQEKSRLSCEYG